RRRGLTRSARAPPPPSPRGGGGPGAGSRPRGGQQLAGGEHDIRDEGGGPAVGRPPRAHPCPPPREAPPANPPIIVHRSVLRVDQVRPDERASSDGLRRHTSTAVAARTRVTFSISLTSTHASSSSALPRIVAGPYRRHGIPAFQRWHVSSAL